MINELIPYKIADILPTLVSGRMGKISQRMLVVFDREKFASDTLDVAGLYPFARPENCVISFAKTPLYIRNESKVMARYEIFFGKAPTTVQKHIDNLTAFFRAYEARYGNTDCTSVTIDAIKKVLKTSYWSSGQCEKICVALKIFYIMLNSYYPKHLLETSLQDIDDLRRHYMKIVMATANAHKTPDIENKYFDELQERLPMLMWDDALPINYRMTATLIYLEMFTGLRPSELFDLTVSSHVVEKSNSGKELDYMNYGTPKLSHGGSVQVYSKCYLLPQARTAFDALCELRKKVPGHDTTDRLFIFENNLRPNEKQVDYYVVRLFQQQFSDIVYDKWENINVRIIKDRKTYIPNFTQYRVHLCSFLYRNNVSRRVIEMGMSHLSATMDAYYYRIEDKTFAEYQRRADIVIQSHISNDFSGEDVREIGESLLRGFNLSYSRFNNALSRYNEMLEKEYAFEAQNYGMKALNIINYELHPALCYMEKLLNDKGADYIVSNYPNLGRVVPRVAELIKEVNQWQRNLTTH